jgi:hypothetical protein
MNQKALSRNSGRAQAIHLPVSRQTTKITITARARLLISSSGHAIFQVQKQYHYTALPTGNSIRLLELHYDYDEDKLIKNLITQKIDKALKNTAISYIRGDPTCIKYLLCPNDRPTDTVSNSYPDHASNLIGSDTDTPLSIEAHPPSYW